jgi:hypothetical protein
MADFNTIKNKSLIKALQPDKTNNRISQFNNTSSGIDMRSGNILVSDELYRRIVIGQLPDKTYGIAVSKPDNDVIGAFS